MNKQQIKEAILGKEGCRKEETPLTQFATFHPDMEMVELLLKGADIDKAFNNRPIDWVHQFCAPNWDKMLLLLFKYKYYALKIDRNEEFSSLINLLNRVKTQTIISVLKTLKKHHFVLSPQQFVFLKDFQRVFDLWHQVFLGE